MSQVALRPASGYSLRSSLSRLLARTYRLALGLAAVVVAGLQIWSFEEYRSFYGAFGVTPDELGYNATLTLIRSGLLVLAEISSVALALAGPIAVFGAMGAVLAGFMHEATLRVRVSANWAHLLTWHRNLNEPQRTVIHLAIPSFVAAVALAAVAGLFFLAANTLLDLGSLRPHIKEVRSGERLRYEFYSNLSLAQPRADPVWVRWLGDRPPRAFSESGRPAASSVRLTYFGGASGTLVFFEHRRDRVLRLPAAAIAIDAADPRDG